MCVACFTWSRVVRYTPVRYTNASGDASVSDHLGVVVAMTYMNKTDATQLGSFKTSLSELFATRWQQDTLQHTTEFQCRLRNDIHNDV